MKKILLINLRRFGDIFYSGQVLKGLAEKYPKAEISILTYQESSRAARAFAQFQNIFTVDREKLGILLKGGPFSFAHSFKELKNSLESVGFEWDLIVNLSNCTVSAYLTSYLSQLENNYKGVRYNANGFLEFSDDWITWANEIMVDLSVTPFSYMEVFTKSLELNTHPKTPVEFVCREGHEVSTQNIFSRLHTFRDSDQIHTVALQLTASTPEKSASLQESKELIQQIFSHQNLYPILLVGPSKEDRIFAQALNEAFENSLFSIEADFIGLNSILKSIDILITVDTSVKHLAALHQTKLLELYFNQELLFKMPATSGSHLVLVDRNKVGTAFTTSAQFIANCCWDVLQDHDISSKTPAGTSIFNFDPGHGFSLIDTRERDVKELYGNYVYQRACVAFALEMKFQTTLSVFSKELLSEYREILSTILAAYREMNASGPISAKKIFSAINNLEPSNYGTSPFQVLLGVRKTQAMSKFCDDVEANRKVFKEFLLTTKDEFLNLKQSIVNNLESTQRQRHHEI